MYLVNPDSVPRDTERNVSRNEEHGHRHAAFPGGGLLKGCYWLVSKLAVLGCRF